MSPDNNEYLQNTPTQPSELKEIKAPAVWNKSLLRAAFGVRPLMVRLQSNATLVTKPDLVFCCFPWAMEGKNKSQCK